MRIFETFCALSVLWCAVGASPACAHGELHEMIVSATKAIEKEPGNAELYLKRSDLYRSHRAWDAALADLERAQALSNQWHLLHFARAGVFLDAEWFESAKVAADRFLAHEPNHVGALVTRARARARLGERLAAADDYTRAIASSAAPNPELFIERAEALVAEGSGHFDSALRGLDEGIRMLGPLVTLQLFAIDLEVKQHRIDPALARIDRAMKEIPRKETWLTRRGEILQQAGRNKEATEAFLAASNALNSLPPARRSLPSMTDLEQRIRLGLATTGN